MNLQKHILTCILLLATLIVGAQSFTLSGKDEAQAIG